MRIAHNFKSKHIGRHKLNATGSNKVENTQNCFSLKTIAKLQFVVKWALKTASVQINSHVWRLQAMQDFAGVHQVIWVECLFDAAHDLDAWAAFGFERVELAQADAVFASAGSPGLECPLDDLIA